MTPAEIDQLARTAAARSRFMMTAGDMAYRRDLAWSVIVEAVHLDGIRDPRHLVYLATSEIDREVKQLRRSSGHDTSGRTEWAPMFWRYWEPLPRGGPEHAVVDRVALHQIWQTLTPTQRTVVEAVSLHDSHAQAARALGMSVTVLAGHLATARRRVFALWHEGETPSTLWRATLKGRRRDTCRRGHPLTSDNVAWRGSAGCRSRTCLTCKRESQLRYRRKVAS